MVLLPSADFGYEIKRQRIVSAFLKNELIFIIIQVLLLMSWE